MAVGAGGVRSVVRVDAILRGAGLGAPLVVGAALAYELADGDGGDTPVVALPLTIVLLGGLCLAGLVAARHAPAAPFTNAALAALLIVVTLQLLAIAAALARDRSLPAPAAVLFRLFIAYGAGLLGAFAASRTARRQEPA